MADIIPEFDKPMREIAALLDKGAIAGIATHTTYALVTSINSKNGVKRLRKLRNLSASKPLALLMKDLSAISKFGYVDRPGFRLMKNLSPGEYTFILRATKEVPKLMQTRQHTIGIRISSRPIVTALCETLGQPLVSASAVYGEEGYASTAEEVADGYPDIEWVLDGGTNFPEMSTVIDLTGPRPELLRQGAGPVDFF